MSNAAQVVREAARNGTLDAIPLVEVDDPREVETEAAIDDVLYRMNIDDTHDREIVREVYRQTCNTIKLYKLQQRNALAMEDINLADQFHGAARRAAQAAMYLEDAYPWLRD